MFFFFFFNDPAPPEISPLPLPAALPILPGRLLAGGGRPARVVPLVRRVAVLGMRRLLLLPHPLPPRSEEHTSELQSQSNLVCRLLLEKKKQKQQYKSCIVSIDVI